MTAIPCRVETKDLNRNHRAYSPGLYVSQTMNDPIDSFCPMWEPSYLHLTHSGSTTTSMPIDIHTQNHALSVLKAQRDWDPNFFGADDEPLFFRLEPNSEDKESLNGFTLTFLGEGDTTSIPNGQGNHPMSWQSPSPSSVSTNTNALVTALPPPPTQPQLYLQAVPEPPHKSKREINFVIEDPSQTR